MKPEWTEQIAKDNFKLYKDYDGFRLPWERDAKRCDDFRYGTHFSRLEEEELLKFRQAPLPISITTAICDTADALTVASKPTITVAPIVFPNDDDRTASSRSVANLYRGLLQKSWYDSLGSLQHDRVVRDSTNVGHGLYYVVPKFQYGEFTVDFRHLSWRHFYPDPQSKDPFYRDSDNMVYSMIISQKAGWKFVRSLGTDITEKEYIDQFVKNSRGTALSTELPTRYSPNRLRDNGVNFTQRLTLEDEKVYRLIPTPKFVEVSKDNIQFATYSTITPEMEQWKKEGLIKIEEDTEMRLVEYTSVGGLGCKKVYPIDSYNIVPLTYDHRDNPYPLGRIWYLYPLQRALNKFIMIAVLNGSLMNSTRIMAEEGQINDKYEFRKNFAQPGAILEYRRSTNPNTKAPIIIEAKPLNEAWLAMPKYLTYVMEYVSGIFGVMQGDSTESPSVFSTVASLQSAGGIKIKRRLAQADATLSIVGEVAGKFYKEYAPPRGYATSIDEVGAVKEEIRYNELKVDDGKVIVDPNTDLRTGFRSVRFASQGSNGFEAATEAAMLTTLATQLKVSELVPVILKKLNLPEVDKVIQDISQVNVLTAQNGQLQNVVKELESRAKIMANQIEQMSYQMKAANFGAELKKIALDFKAQAETKSNGVE